MESPVFRLLYADSDSNLVDEVADLIESEYLDLRSRLGLNLSRPAVIYLAPSEAMFNRLTGNFIPDWGEGVADPARGLIVLKSPNLTHNYASFPELVRHELTHILVGRAATRPHTVPKWFHEGMAIYFSYDSEFAGGEAISKALITNSVIPLEEIENVLKFRREKARLAYEESYSAILYLEETYGYNAILDFLRQLREGRGFKEGFLEVFGRDVYDFELDWYEYLENKYRWRFLLDFETFLWIFILLVFILAFIAIRLRNRRTLKRWEDEERLGDPWAA